jgi:hypothetical protein
VNVLKCEYGYIDETMIHDVERAFERIFYDLGIKKSVLDVVNEVMF